MRMEDPACLLAPAGAVTVPPAVRAYPGVVPLITFLATIFGAAFLPFSALAALMLLPCPASAFRRAVVASEASLTLHGFLAGVLLVAAFCRALS